jgi:hypothetical protein
VTENYNLSFIWKAVFGRVGKWAWKCFFVSRMESDGMGCKNGKVKETETEMEQGIGIGIGGITCRICDLSAQKQDSEGEIGIKIPRIFNWNQQTHYDSLSLL